MPSRLSALTRCCVQSCRKGISSVGAQERRRYPVRVRSGSSCKDGYWWCRVREGGRQSPEESGEDVD